MLASSPPFEYRSRIRFQTLPMQFKCDEWIPDPKEVKGHVAFDKEHNCVASILNKIVIFIQLQDVNCLLYISNLPYGYGSAKNDETAGEIHSKPFVLYRERI